MPLEKDLEYKCRLLVKARGGELLKFKSPGNKGVHDRLMVLPGFAALVEFKKDRRAKVQPLQDYWQERFTKLGMMSCRIVSLAHFRTLLAYAETHTTTIREREDAHGD